MSVNNISRFRIDHAIHKLHYSMHSAHSHTYYELFYLMHGNCTISIDDRLYTLSEGNVVFFLNLPEKRVNFLTFFFLNI